VLSGNSFLRLQNFTWQISCQNLWVPKMPSESFRPEYHQIDGFNFDSAFVNSDNSASHSLGQTNLRKIRPSFRDGPFGLFRKINLIAPIPFLRLDLRELSASCLVFFQKHVKTARRKLTIVRSSGSLYWRSTPVTELNSTNDGNSALRCAATLAFR
jgi:hypothetical protein